MTRHTKAIEEGTDEKDFEAFLLDAIERRLVRRIDEPVTFKAKTFSQAGILSDNAGLEVRIGQSVFQVTIVQKE